MLDWHWVKFVEVEGFGERHLPKPITVTLTYEGLDVVAALSHDGSGFALHVVGKASDPHTVKNIEALFKEAIETTGRPNTMNISFHRSNFNVRLVQLSVLRAAYLAGVAVCG